jgi:regulator of protease activity HflC (stomatin/prohibitin superfamily)
MFRRPKTTVFDFDSPGPSLTVGALQTTQAPPRWLTVTTAARAVEYVDGRLTRVLEPGRHRTKKRAEYGIVSLRATVTTLAPQEILTADGLPLRVTVAVRWQVTDPPAYLDAAEHPFDLVYLAVQVALRDAIAAIPVEEAAAKARRELTAPLTAAAQRAAAGLGIEVAEALVKDIILPADVRAAHAELITAKLRGAAQLEAARAETAALRSLANGAKLLDDHPALARLRLIQALPPGATVKVVTPA